MTEKTVSIDEKAFNELVESNKFLKESNELLKDEIEKNKIENDEANKKIANLTSNIKSSFEDDKANFEKELSELEKVNEYLKKISESKDIKNMDNSINELSLKLDDIKTGLSVDDERQKEQDFAHFTNLAIVFSLFVILPIILVVKTLKPILDSSV